LPLVIKSILPAEIFLESLFECSPWFPFIIPKFYESISPRSEDEFLLTLINKTDVVDSFVMGLNLEFLLDGVGGHDNFALLVRKIVNID
jgi:hypothetical protein